MTASIRKPRGPGWGLRPSDAGIGVVLGVVLLLGTFGCGSTPPTAYRGRVVERRPVRTDRQSYLTVNAMAAADGRVRFQIATYETVTSQELPIYEKVLEFRSEGELDRGKIRHKLVPDEYIQGEVETRTEQTSPRPLAGAPVLLNGVPGTTGADGVLVDTEEVVLSAFDEPFRGEVQVTIRHDPLDEARLTLTRAELLGLLGVNVDTEKLMANDALKATIEWAPREPQVGARIQMTLTVSNPGHRFAGTVEGRLFSRCPWLDGRAFYIGGIEPGQTRSFTRLLQVPTDQPPGDAFGIMGVWDRLGAPPERNLPFTLTVRAGSSPPGP